MVNPPNLVKEAGIPDWGGRLYLKIQQALNGLAATVGTVTSVSSANGDLSVATGTSTPVLTVNSAPKWDTARALSFTGDVTGSGSVDGSAAVATALTLATAQPAAHTWALAQTFTVAPVFTNASGSRTALGLGTAATQNTGTSGANVPLLNGANTWSASQTFNNLVTTPTTFAGLPGSPAAGQRANITNCNTTVFSAAAAGGGSSPVPVYFDGAIWRVG